MNPEKLRELRIASLLRDVALKSLDDMSIDEMWTLAEEAANWCDQVGPFDVAYEHFARQHSTFSRLAFYRECVDRNLDQIRENALKELLPILGRNLFTHSAESALAKACELDALANNPNSKLPYNSHPRHVAVKKTKEASDAYLALAAMFPPPITA